MESWKSGSQMTRTIDLRHWAQRGDIVPRCGDRTFSALEGGERAHDGFHWSQEALPVAPPAHINLRCDVLVPHGKAPRRCCIAGASRVLGAKGVIPKQDALNQSPPVGRVPDSAAPVGAI